MWMAGDAHYPDGSHATMIIRPLGLATLMLGLMFGAPSGAPAAFIDFDNGTQGATIGSFYSALGVTFSNAQFDGFVSTGEGAVGAGGLKMISISDTYSPKKGNPIVAIFSGAVSF